MLSSYLSEDLVDNLFHEFARGGHPSSPDELCVWEDSSRALGQQLEGALTARSILACHSDKSFIDKCIHECRMVSPHPLKHMGLRTVKLTLKGGVTLSLRTPYLNVKHPPATAKRQHKAKRRRKQLGCYPVLAALGIVGQFTPMVQQEIAHTFVSAQSYAEASSQLRRIGLHINVKTALAATLTLAREVKQIRDSLMAQAMEQPVSALAPLAGQNVLISVDGGRAHMREPYTSGRRKKNGRRGFEANWREPRGFIIQILDQNGKPSLDHHPFYEMTLANADQTFDLLLRYLRLFGAAFAKKLVFVADGAEWIWNRVDELLLRADVPVEKVFTLVDFYHACENLQRAISVRSCDSQKERERIFKRLRRPYADEPDNSEDPMVKATQYFADRKERMHYPRVRAEGLPIGSGSIESAIRRVLNMRFKGPGLLWRRETLEELMHIRALVKAGRWFQSPIDAYMRFNKNVSTTQEAPPESIEHSDEVMNQSFPALTLLPCEQATVHNKGKEEATMPTRIAS